MATPAAVLSIMVEANTGAATANLAKTNAELDATKASAVGATGATSKAGSALKKMGTIAKVGAAAGLAAFAYEAKKAIDTTDQLALGTISLHKNLGLSVKTASEWASVARARGADTTKLGMAFKTLATQVSAAGHGSATAWKMFHELGFTQKDVQIAMNNTEFATKKVADGLNALPGSVDKATIAGKLFGRGWQTIAPILRDGSKAMQDQLNVANKYGATFTGGNLKKWEDFIQTQREAKIAWQGMQVQLANALMPTIKDVIGQFNHMAAILANPKLSNDQKFRKIAHLIQQDFQKVMDFVLKLIPEIANNVGRAVPKVASAFVTGFLKADAWGKLAIGGFLFSKLGGASAIKAAGSKLMGMLFGGSTGGIAGKLGGLASQRGSTPANPLFVDVINQSPIPGGPGPVGVPTESEPGWSKWVRGLSAVTAVGFEAGAVDALSGGTIHKALLDLFTRRMPWQGGTDIGPHSQGAFGKQPTGATAQQARQSVTGLPPSERDAATKQAVRDNNTIMASDDKVSKNARAAFAIVIQALQGLRDKYGSLNKAADHLSAHQKEAYLKQAQAAERSGAMTIGALGKVQDAFGATTDKATRQAEKLHDQVIKATKDTSDKVGGITQRQAQAVVNNYNSMNSGVRDGLGQLQDMTNAALKQLGVNATVNFRTSAEHPTTNPKTGQHLGRQRGGPIPGAGSGDKVPAMLEPGEFVLNREAVKGIGAARLEAMNKAMPRFKKGGLVFPLQGNYSWGRIDEGVDFGGTAKIAAMGDAVVTSTANFFSNVPGATGGVLYKLLGGAPGVSPSSPYIYNYEHIRPRVKQGQHVKAGQVIADLLPGFPGLEMGFATSSGSPIASGTYSEGDVTSAGQAMMQLLKGLSHGKFFGGSAFQKLKRILLEGPDGAVKDIGQGALDKTWRAANAFLKKKSAHSTTMGIGRNVKVPAGNLSLPELGRLTKAHGGPPILQYVAWNESNGDPHAVSSAGAEGLWQFLPSTWAGLHVKGSPFNPNDAAAGAHKLYQQSGLSPWSPSEYAGAHGGWHQDLGKGYTLKRGGMVMPPYGGSFAQGGIVPGPRGAPRTIVAHGGEKVEKAPSRYAITITNWNEGTGYMEEIAGDTVNGQVRLSRQRERMRR